MGLFHRRRIKNVANLATNDGQISRPQNIVYHDSNPWPGIIFVSFICLMFLIPFVWLIGVFLLRRAGIHHPDRALANGIISLVWLLAILLLGTLFVRFLILAILDTVFEHRQAMKRMDIDMLRSRQLLAQVPMGHRANEEDQRFARLIQLVMFQAYQHLKEHGLYGQNDPRPWSRRQAEALVLAGERKPVGYALAQRVRPFLSEHLIVKDNQVNAERFPALADVQHLLNRLYDIPVVARIETPGQVAMLRDNEGFVFTE